MAVMDCYGGHEGVRSRDGGGVRRVEQRGGLVRFAAALARQAARKRKQRVAAAELSGLSDRILADIGVRRDDIQRLVQVADSACGKGAL